MDKEVDELRNEVAAVRADFEQRRQRSVTRRRMLTGVAGVGAASAAGVVRPTAARADDGDPLLLGEENSATDLTKIETTNNLGTSTVYLGVAAWGLYSIAEDVGVLGTAGSAGVAGVWGDVAGPVGSGVTGNASDVGAIGVIASSEAGPALAALSRLDGVTLELTPAERTGPPSAMPTDLSEYHAGSLSVDENSEVWLCTATGAPGTWTRLLREDTAVGRVITVTPTRALDTRVTGGRPSGSPAVPGQKKGPLKGGETITLDLAGVAPIPASASGIVGNLTVIGSNYSGYIVVGPSGTTPSTSALNFATGATVGNNCTTKLGPDGLSVRGYGGSANTYHLVVDITAYIT